MREDEEAQQRELSMIIGHMQDFADKISSNLEEVDWLKRREIIRALVKQIEVDEEVVRIVYRVNPPPFVQAPEKGFLQHCSRRERPALWCPFCSLRHNATGHYTCLQVSAN